MINKPSKKTFLLILVTLFCLLDNLSAQWVNDPSSNTKLVIDPEDPINISALKDLSGGAYVFWQDKKSNSESDIYFIHLDKDGKVSFRADGKVVSTKSGLKENPIAVVDPSGNSIVIWAGRDKKNNQELFIQKLTKNGLRLWQNEGIQLTDRFEKIDYSLRVDKRGYSHTSYICKSSAASNKYSVRYQILTPNGKVLSDSSKGIMFSSNNNISEVEIVPDNKGGSAIFWLENQNQKTVLRTQFIDSTGSKRWGKNPITISKTNASVINYSIGKLGRGIYAAITYQGNPKIIYQQLISDKGKLLWGTDGMLLSYQKGSQIYPQFAFVDSSVVVSWTNEFDKLKDVFIQRFDISGNRLWGNNGKRIINIKGDQFGQRIIYDQKNGIIVAWIDKRDNSSNANLFIQKLNLNGNFIWDSSGVIISSSKHAQKSYLNLVPDGDGGAIAIFKGSFDNRNDIYGQKIFSTGTYASQILGFDAEVIKDSVKVFWYAANENEGTTYSVYRSADENARDGDWKLAGTLKKNNENKNNYYEFYDWPDINGSIYYRVIQKNENIKPQSSGIEKVDYFRDVESIVLAQNSPNPFSDSTTISFYLPQDGEVTFEFFNSNIETVKKIEDVEYPEGKNEIVFKTEELPPGIYFYRLKVDKFVDVKKMVITDK
jgi:hypothetical protein